MNPTSRDVNVIKKFGKGLILEVVTTAPDINSVAQFTLKEAGLEDSGDLLIEVTEILVFLRTRYQDEVVDSLPVTLFNKDTPDDEYPLVLKVISENLLHLDKYITEYYETEDYVVTA